jgi:hypothetical protein
MSSTTRVPAARAWRTASSTAAWVVGVDKCVPDTSSAAHCEMKPASMSATHSPMSAQLSR